MITQQPAIHPKPNVFGRFRWDTGKLIDFTGERFGQHPSWRIFEDDIDRRHAPERLALLEVKLVSPLARRYSNVISPRLNNSTNCKFCSSFGGWYMISLMITSFSLARTDGATETMR